MSTIARPERLALLLRSLLISRLVSLLTSLLAFCVILTPATAQAATCSATSPPGTTALIELYTSEGCDSCPPADRWLSTLKRGNQAAAQVVALAFHVDYWDRLGWQDRYASPQFGRRQTEQVRLHGGRTVYTPQVMLGGNDFRDWQDGMAYTSAVRAINARPAQANLTLQLHSDAAGAWTGDLSGATRNANVLTYVAVYENGLSSDVAAGENRGKRLTHDFVVRDWIGPLKIGSGSAFQTSTKLPARTDINYAKAGVAAFLQDATSGDILQAIALDFCR